MSVAALIPFVLLLICFVGLRFPLTISSFIALVSGSLLTAGVFNGSLSVWVSSINRTVQIMVEIGLIMLGAFFFLEVAKKLGIIQSLAKFVQEVTSNRVAQVILVIFPLELMVEGSSGFGTPLLIVAPILYAMGFPALMCAVLPFMICVGIPFGALGTPIRLGFPGAVDPSHGAMILLLPILFIAPLLASLMVSQKPKMKELIWILFLSSLYGILSFHFSKGGPEFTTLVPAFITFITGVVSARLFFKSESLEKIKEIRGISIYGVLLALMWLGKQIFMDQLIPGTRFRIFNPGFLFFIFGCALLLIYQVKQRREIFKATFERSRRTLFVFFCMTFVVQQLRENGGVDALTHSIPEFLLGAGTPVLGWIGSLFVGTSTVSNLLTSKAVDPIHYIAIAAGSGIGVQMAFQSMVAMRSTLNDQISEKDLFLKIAPMSIGFMIITTVFYAFVSGFLK